MEESQVLEKCQLFLAMEDRYYAGPQEASWAPYNSAAMSNESSSFPLPWPPHASSSTQFQFCGGFPNSWSATALKSHSQAEKRRRDRINAQLATLRRLIPKSDKMDKATLLGSVIDHVKDLKRKAMEVSKAFTVPTDVDEITIDSDPAQAAANSSSNNIMNKNRCSIVIRASVCCDDRPELFSELIQVIKGLNLKAVRADMASVGGRIKSVLVLCKDGEDEPLCISTLKQSLKLVLSKICAASMAPNCRIRSKRQRFFLPFQYPN